MPNKNQQTIVNAISCSGIGIHSAQKVNMTLKQAPINTGITFTRTDISDKTKSQIKANYKNVTQTNLGTTIDNGLGAKVCTVEHLLAGIWGADIDNLIIEIDNEELPIFDGSSEPFIFLIECAGIKIQQEARKYIQILRDLEFNDEDKFIKVAKADSFQIDLKIDFQDNVVGSQSHFFDENNSSFKHDIAKARTFGFKNEIEYLNKIGLAKGGSLKNAILVEDNDIANQEGLRFENEFARHKLLDFIGDAFLAGYRFKGKFTAFKSGHDMNNKFLHQLFADKDNYIIS
jgi:UDP-3-O-[3-hydroxymyristoyl] N-acetylglucosamine deacetylase